VDQTSGLEVSLGGGDRPTRLTLKRAIGRDRRGGGGRCLEADLFSVGAGAVLRVGFHLCLKRREFEGRTPRRRRKHFPGSIGINLNIRGRGRDGEICKNYIYKNKIRGDVKSRALRRQAIAGLDEER